MKPKKPKVVSTGVFIDAVTPHMACVTYPDGSKVWVYDCVTLEDLRNREDEQQWYRNQCRRIR